LRSSTKGEDSREVLLMAIIGGRVMQTSRIALFLSLCSIFVSTMTWAEPVVPEIPGLTVEDPFPRGCVDCHIDRPEAQMDVRISTRMRTWSEQVEAKVLERVQAIMTGTAKLSGRHPRLSEESYQDIPANCMQCHSAAQNSVPRMGPMLHALHLIGAQENHFFTLFGGECTHCHKFEANTGTWSIPSGPEN